MNFQNILNNLVENGINKIKEKENMENIQKNIVDPLISYTYKRLYPYFIILIIIFILTFILALLIFMIQLKQTLNSKN